MLKRRLSWHRRDHADMLSVFRQLGPEGGGLLSAFIDLCCTVGGPVDDDARYISGNLGIDVRTWKRVRRQLIAEGFLYERHDGRSTLSSLIADVVIADSNSRYENACKAGRLSAAAATKRMNQARITGERGRRRHETADNNASNLDANFGENRGLDPTPVEQPLQLRTRTQTKKRASRREAVSIGDLIRQSEVPAICDGVKAADRMRVTSDGEHTNLKSGVRK